MTETLPAFDPFAPGFTEDPYPHYALLREAVGVEEHALGFWVLWRHADVAEVLRARLSVEDRKVTQYGPLRAMYEEVYGTNGARRGDGMSMLDRDPPDHTRLRRLVSTAFTPKRVQELEPTVQRFVDDALDRLAADGGGNLVDALAFPLPFAVISSMMGMPDIDQTRLRDLSGMLVRSLEPVPDIETMRAVLDADVEMQGLARDAIAWKREHPADDLLTALINAEEDGDVLSDQELVAQVILLYVAGHETTVNLIANGALALLRDPGQAALWRGRPDLDDNAVEELLRFDSPVQMSRRVTLEPLTVDGHTIAAGTFVVASLGSANRDPAVFGADADQVRLDRANARQHVSFGAGVHHCLGAALARMEGRVALASLVRRFPDLTLAGDPVHNGRLNLRGLTDLPVSV